jgi:putative transposase
METCTAITQDVEKRHIQTGIKAGQLLKLYGIKRSTFYNWVHCNWLKIRKAKVTKPTQDEVDEVLKFRQLHPLLGYRNLTWLMNDADLVSLPESAIYRILIEHDALTGYNRVNPMGCSKEYQNKPLYVHHHWHTDISYIKVRGVFTFS